MKAGRLPTSDCRLPGALLANPLRICHTKRRLATLAYRSPFGLIHLNPLTSPLAIVAVAAAASEDSRRPAAISRFPGLARLRRAIGEME